ncbi:MAG TPA: hypothetical protein VHR36_12620 [Pyrinomonadaceae bacterium]|nr:hypothetical protein [Pyrinomonadaceae bacterium]
MSQLATLIWLKWTLFRNSMRKSKAVINRLASVLTMLAALALSLLIAAGLGVAAYALTAPGSGIDTAALTASHRGRADVVPSAEFIFFSIFSLFYLLWATLPLSLGGGRQFDPGNLLLYPISLRKLFALDFLSEIVTLQSLFAIPAILAIGIGVGLGTGKMGAAILLTLTAAAFGLALSKWVSTSIGSLIRRKRTRGETLLALVGAIAGLGGALFGQLAPIIFKHADSIAALRWTPPGAVAYALTGGLRAGHATEYVLVLSLLLAYTSVLVLFTYWLTRRATLGGGSTKQKSQRAAAPGKQYTGWNLPFISPELSAIIEKEVRYSTRNAQLRMMTLMPLILIVIRFINRRRFAPPGGGSATGLEADFFDYGAGLMATTGILYVFLILAGLFCNQFAFDQAGMRTLILSPVDRKKVLLGKNISLTLLALTFCAGLLVVNEIVFQDLSAGAVLFAALSFVAFASLLSLMGNWFSIHFPKRVKFGKRLNVSGVVGLLLIPMIVLLALVPLAATAAGYVAQSVSVEYVTLAVLAALSLGFYLLLLPSQGEAVQKRELAVHEAVNDPGND